MCDLSMALSIGGSLFSAFQQMQQANSAARAAEVTAANNQKIAEYNASVSDNNAKIEKANAVDALQRGASDAAVQRENYRKANATARASAASTGLLADKGTVGDLIDQNVVYGEMNALTVMNNAEREAYGFNLKATDFVAEAQNQRLQGQVGVANAGYQANIIRSNGMADAMGTLVKGGGNIYDKYIYKGSSALGKK